MVMEVKIRVERRLNHDLAKVENPLVIFFDIPDPHVFIYFETRKTQIKPTARSETKKQRSTTIPKLSKKS